MDIQKEEDDFNAWFNKQTINAVPDADLSLQRLWASLAWQAVKSQAVPEGFVVLAIDDMERICRCLDDHAVYITYKASDALESIQKSMIEAQEQK